MKLFKIALTLCLIMTFIFVNFSCKKDHHGGDDDTDTDEDNVLVTKTKEELISSLGENYEINLDFSGADASGNYTFDITMKKDKGYLFYKEVSSLEQDSVTKYLIHDNKIYYHDVDQNKYVLFPGGSFDELSYMLIGYHLLLDYSSMTDFTYNKVTNVKVAGYDCKEYEYVGIDNGASGKVVLTIENNTKLCFKLLALSTATYKTSYEIKAFKKGSANIDEEIALLTNQGGSEIGDNQNPPFTQDDWISNEILTKYHLEELPKPAENSFEVMTLETNTNHSIYIGFKQNYENEFENYVKSLYDIGFNEQYNEQTGMYATKEFNELFTNNTMIQSFDAYKHVKDQYRLHVFGQKYTGMTSLTITYEDFSERGEKFWFSQKDAEEMELPGLDVFANIADKEVIVSTIEYRHDEIDYQFKLTGVTFDDMKELCEYFFEKGAKYSCYEDSYDNPFAKFDDDELFTYYSDYAYFAAGFCSDCAVYITWNANNYDELEEGSYVNQLFVELCWGEGHTSANH